MSWRIGLVIATMTIALAGQSLAIILAAPTTSETRRAPANGRTPSGSLRYIRWSAGSSARRRRRSLRQRSRRVGRAFSNSGRIRLRSRKFYEGVDDRIRTGDRLDHNQELYQLSYVHRGSSNLPATRSAKAWKPGVERATRSASCSPAWARIGRRGLGAEGGSRLGGHLGHGEPGVDQAPHRPRGGRAGPRHSRAKRLELGLRRARRAAPPPRAGRTLRRASAGPRRRGASAPRIGSAGSWILTVAKPISGASPGRDLGAERARHQLRAEADAEHRQPGAASPPPATRARPPAPGSARSRRRSSGRP